MGSFKEGGVFSEEFLKSRNLTLRELSRRTGIKYSTIRNINSKKCGTTTDNYEKICRAAMVDSLQIPHVDYEDKEMLPRGRKRWPLSKIHESFLLEMADYRGVDHNLLKTEIEFGGMGWGTTSDFDDKIF